MHPSAPLVEELENVPRGHGNNVATSQLLSAILLNPVAKRAEIRCVFIWGPDRRRTKIRLLNESSCARNINRLLSFLNFSLILKCPKS